MFERDTTINEVVVVDPATLAAVERSKAHARKVLVIDRGGLGDAIHMIPALDLLRRNYPAASLQVLVGYQGLFEKLTPWIDRVWPGLNAKVFDNLELMRQLRREAFDAVYTLSWRGSAIVAAALNGAELTIGRRGPPDKPWWWQPRMLSKVVSYPLRTEPMWYQKWMCLRRAGLLGSVPRFDVRLDRDWFFECGLNECDRKSYLHVSLCTAVEGRDLAVEQMVELLEGLAKLHSRIAISTDGSAPQIKRLCEIVARLSFEPWRICAGNLQLHQFVALIENACLHLGGDTGSLHVARLVGTPSISWFKVAFGNVHWAPTDAEIDHKVIFSADARADALHGIRTADLLSLAADALRPVSPPMRVSA